MRHGIVGGWLILMFAVPLMAGRADSAENRLDSYGLGESNTLRVATDTAGGRLWALGLDEVRVYDTITKKLIRQIALPNWSVNGAVCGPGLALDRSGSAFISSNVQPTLLRIDADSFALKVHEISLEGKEQWEIGFGAIAFNADGALYAITSSANSLWKIDVARASASMIDRYYPPPKTCALGAQLALYLNRIEGNRQPWTTPSPQQN